ncbi:RNA-binding protein [Candidatus Daviesbacteria bacterium]|nr:RNA-binding protein [Candidatus Daviesbacteria bacterium]
MKKLFVGNLPWSVGNDQLAQLFSKYPSVTSASVIMDRQTNRSRGFGFVEFSDDNEALKAVSEMNETEVDDRKIFVNEARPQNNG